VDIFGRDKMKKGKCIYCSKSQCSGKIEDHCNYCGEYLKTKFKLDPEYCSKSCYSADRKFEKDWNL